MKDNILDVVQDTAKDLAEAGVMNMTTLREFDAICLPEVERYDAELYVKKNTLARLYLLLT